MLERKVIDNLAVLARLDLPDAEKDRLQKDMESILGYVAELQKAPAVAESHQSGDYFLKNVMREDTDAYDAGANTEVILAEAPKVKNGCFAVKKILDN